MEKFNAHWDHTTIVQSCAQARENIVNYVGRFLEYTGNLNAEIPITLITLVMEPSQLAMSSQQIRTYDHK
jgi:hypothetical protein